MNKAQVKFELNELITIDNKVYHVAEHPALRGVPYVQRGARGFVIQLIAPDKERFALKYFKMKYRVPALVQIGKALRQYAELPGLRAAFRTVFTQETHPALIRKYPALEYGVLMPWVAGQTWFDIVAKKQALSATESVHVAQQTSRVLATLEDHGLAHCDIAGANVVADAKMGRIELVDIEEMFGPGLPQPVEFPAGQEGYQHRRSATAGQWMPAGDRFGGAIILAEMLGWQNLRVRQNSADEHFFAGAEMQERDTPRFKMLHDYLAGEFGADFAAAFEQAWRSATLEDCPPLATWRALLDKLNPLPVAAAPRGNEVVTGRRELTGPKFPDAKAAFKPELPEAIPSRAEVAQPRAEPTRPTAVPAATRLCPRCGAANMPGAEFCVRCRYYLRGEQRPARTVITRPASTPVSPGAASAPHPISNTVATPTMTKEVVASRRTMGTGASGSASTPPPTASDTDGKWVVLAVVVGFILTLLIIVITIPH